MLPFADAASSYNFISLLLPSPTRPPKPQVLEAQILIALVRLEARMLNRLSRAVFPAISHMLDQLSPQPQARRARQTKNKEGSNDVERDVRTAFRAVSLLTLGQTVVFVVPKDEVVRVHVARLFRLN